MTKTRQAGWSTSRRHGSLGRQGGPARLGRVQRPARTAAEAITPPTRSTPAPPPRAGRGDTSADAAPTRARGAAVITPANAAMATTVAKHDTAVNVTTPQPDTRIANTDSDGRRRRGQQHTGNTRGARHRQKARNRGECGGDHAQRQPGERSPDSARCANHRKQQGNQARPMPPRLRCRGPDL